MFDVVPAHLVEGVLRLQDVVAEIQDDEPLTHHLDYIGCFQGETHAVDVLFGVSEGLRVEDESLEVLAVEGDDVLVDKIPLHRVHPS